VDANITVMTLRPSIFAIYTNVLVVKSRHDITHQSVNSNNCSFFHWLVTTSPAVLKHLALFLSLSRIPANLSSTKLYDIIAKCDIW